MPEEESPSVLCLTGRGKCCVKNDTRYFFMVLEEGKDDQMEKHLTLGSVESQRITLQGKQGQTVI